MNERNKYEVLYTELLDRGDQLHQSNKRRIRRGIVVLIILPVILDAIRLLTDSDKVVFLIIWILIMFVVSAYLISIEYLDSAIEKTLRDVTDTEAEFDGLLPKPELRRGDLHERIREIIEERLAERLHEAENRAAEEAKEVEAAAEIAEAEEAMEELRETASAEIIAAMKEAFDSGKGSSSPAPEDRADGGSGKEDEK